MSRLELIKRGTRSSFLDVVVSEDEDVVELLEQDRKVRRLNEIIPQTLSGRELFIIINRYGLYGKKTMTQREIARKLGISDPMFRGSKKEGDRKNSGRHFRCIII